MSPLYFSGFFLSEYKFLSPIFFACIVFMFSIGKTFCIYKRSLILFLVVLVFSVLIINQYSHLELKYGLVNELVRHTFPYLFLIGSIEYLKKKNIQEILFLVKKYINFNITLLLLESLYRLSTAECPSFYCYKYNSFLYTDSNFTALHALSILSLVTLLKNQIKIDKYWLKFLLLLSVVIFSFSRTAYAAYLIFVFVLYFYRASILLRMIIIFLSLLLVLFLVNTEFFLDVVTDGSFLTKQYIFMSFLDFLKLDITVQLLGYGSGNLIDEIGRESHNIIGLTMEMGFVWLSLSVFIYVLIFFWFGRKSFLLMMPILVSGLVSLYPLSYMSLHFTTATLFYFLNKSLHES